MANKLKQFGQWLGEKRPFRVDWFAKDPQQQLVPEEALYNMPEPMSEKLVEAANRLPVPAKEKKLVQEALHEALDSWRARPHASPNSLVLMTDPVSSISRILTNSLNEIREDNEGTSLSVSILDWVERPAKVNTIQQQIEKKLDLSGSVEALKCREASNSTGTEKELPEQRTLMLIPNLCWCFLRSADGLDGLDYLQDLLPRDRARFWVIGSGIVGWEYLKSTLKFHAYCGKTIYLPPISGEDLQEWLEPLVEEFDIHFPDAALHKRLKESKQLLDFDLEGRKPIEALSEITQEVSASVQSSVRSLKDEVLHNDTTPEEETLKREFFNRLADVSDGVSEVALQVFIKSLRYREVSQKIEEVTTDDDSKAVVLKEASAPNSKKQQMAEDEEKSRENNKDAEKDEDTQEDSQKEHRLVAMTPKLPLLPELSQSDLYLLYSLMLHGDMTVRALANSLGDAPNVVTNQVQLLRNQGLIEQRRRVLKVNPIYYPKVRRELARNNFIIEVP